MSATLIALLAMQSGPVTMQRTLKQGEVDTYAAKVVMDQKMSMGPAGNQTMNSAFEAQYVLKVDKLNAANNTADANMTATTTKVEMGGTMPGLSAANSAPLPKPVHETGVIDTRNRFRPSKVDNAMVSSLMNIGGSGSSESSGLMIELPDHPVKIGDSWSMEVAGMSQMGTGSHKLTVTLLGPGQSNGHSVWKVKLSGDMPVSVDLNKVLGAAGSSGQTQNPFASALAVMTMTMAGTMDYSGTGEVDQVTGKTAKMNYSVVSDLTMQMTPKQGGTGPMTIKVAGTATCTLKLSGY